MTADVDLAAMDQLREWARVGARQRTRWSVRRQGQRFDWGWVVQGLERRLMLAGGLTAENVAEAIARVQPAAVDVSSGVEKGKRREGRGPPEGVH